MSYILNTKNANTAMYSHSSIIPARMIRNAPAPSSSESGWLARHMSSLIRLTIAPILRLSVAAAN